LKHKAWRLIAILAVFGLIAAACGDDDTTASGGGDCETTDNVKVQLQWFAQAQFAGYYQALDEGMYADECLNVTILEGGVDIVPQQVLATGGAEFGLAWVPKALVSNEAGAGIVNISQMFERSGTLEVSFKSTGITSVEDLAGRSVGNWGFGNEYELTAALSKFGVEDASLVAQDFTMTALLNGEIDAAEAMIYNEYAQVLEATNPATDELYQPEDLNVINFNDVGTAMLQDAVWVTEDWISDAANQDIALRFLRATNRGWIDCIDNFDGCVETVLNNGSTLGESHQQWQLNEILGLIFPATDGIGVMVPALWEQTTNVATEQIPELQGVTIPSSAFRTDLAKQAVADLEADGLDVTGEGYERRDIELQPAGE
jgi:NitT/TauT family transport system substrate-binding protein